MAKLKTNSGHGGSPRADCTIGQRRREVSDKQTRNMRIFEHPKASQSEAMQSWLDKKSPPMGQQVALARRPQMLNGSSAASWGAKRLDRLKLRRPPSLRRPADAAHSVARDWTWEWSRGTNKAKGRGAGQPPSAGQPGGKKTVGRIKWPVGLSGSALRAEIPVSARYRINCAKYCQP